MFGYVLPPMDALPRGEQARFQRMYCGLCHTLGRRYGQAARFLLNYDFTFLAILLSDGREPPLKRGRCVPHPVHGREYPVENAALNLAADESVILAWWKLRDDREDRESRTRFLRAEGASAVLGRAYQKAAALRPGFAAAVERQIGRLGELERENCPSLDIPADTFAVLLRDAAAEPDGTSADGTPMDGTPADGTPIDGMSADGTPPRAFSREEREKRRRVLEQLLYHLGRWIYLIDAADDLRRDAVSGSYNPVALRYQLRDGIWTPEAKEAFALTLDHSIHFMESAFELWDFGVWTPLLEAALYRGLFQVGKQVLDGTFHRYASLPHALRERWNASVIPAGEAGEIDKQG